MPPNVINTDIGAMVALRSLEMTRSQLAVTRKQISTGHRVTNSTDEDTADPTAQSVPPSESEETFSVPTHGYLAMQTSAGTSVPGAKPSSAMVAEIISDGRLNPRRNIIADDLKTVATPISHAESSGLGSLVDADLAKESVQLSALRTRQQLDAQTPSLANQVPRSLLSLFK